MPAGTRLAVAGIGVLLAFNTTAADPVADACRALGARLASISAADCEQAGFSAPAQSFLGRGILSREFPSTAQSPKRVLLVGGIHGDELSSVSAVYRWMRREMAQSRTQQLHWQIVPCLNPDGLLARKATRTNARGVDLNRNFATGDWTERAHPYWVQKTRRDRRRYPGASAASEPEVRWLQEEIARFRPHAIVQVHAPYGVLDYDGPRTPPKKLGFLNLKQLGIYPGSLGNYAGVLLGLPTITLELPSAGSLPSPTQLAAIWQDLLDWLDRNLESPAAGVPPAAP